MDFVTILSEELIRAEVLPEDFDFEAHRELVTMQHGDVPVTVTYADSTGLEKDYGIYFEDNSQRRIEEVF